MTGDPVRDHLLEEICRRLVGFGENGEAALLLAPEVAATAVRLAEIASGPSLDRDVAYAVGLLHWYRYLLLDEESDEQDGARALALMRQVHAANPELVPIAIRHALESDQPVTRYWLAGNWPALQVSLGRADPLLADKVIRVLRRAVGDAADDHRDRVSDLANLAAALTVRFRRTGDPADLDEAIAVARSAVAMTEPDREDSGAVLSNLGNALLCRHGHGGDPADLDEAISLQRLADARMPDGANRALTLGRLAKAQHARYKSTGDTGDLDAAIDTARSATTAPGVSEGHLLVYLHFLAEALWDRFQRLGEAADLDETVAIHRRLLTLLPDGHPDASRFLSELGIALTFRYAQTGDPHTLDEAVEVDQKAIAAAGDDTLLRSTALSNLAIALRTRFERTGERTAFAEAAAAHRDAVATAPGEPAYLTAWAHTLLVGYQRTEDLGMLDELIDVDRQAVAATPAGKLMERVSLLADLGTALSTRYHRTDDVAAQQESLSVYAEAAGILCDIGDALSGHFNATGELRSLDNAEQAYRQAVAAVPEGSDYHMRCLSRLGLVLRSRYDRTGDAAVIEECIACTRRVLDATPVDDPARAGELSNLGNALKSRYDHTGQLDVLDEAIRIHRGAVASTHHDRDQSALLSNLAGALRASFDRTGDLALLDESSQALREAVAAATDDGDTHLLAYLANLGVHLALRYEHTGDLAALEESIATLRRAVASTPEGNPDRAQRLSDLGSTLVFRFERTGDLAALDEAIAVTRAAVAGTPDDYPDRPTRLSNLGGALTRRFEHTAQIAILDEAIRTLREAVATVPDGGPVMGMCLSNLASAFSQRFDHTGDQRSLTEAIDAYRRAVDTIPDGHPRQLDYLSNLSNALRKRYDYTGELMVLDESVEVARQAVTASPTGHPDRAQRLTNLGRALLGRHERAPHLGDLNEAVDVARQAFAATPADHPDRVNGLSNLGLALVTRYWHTLDVQSLEEATQALRDAEASTPDSHPDKARYLSNLTNVLQVHHRYRSDPGALDEAVAVARRAVAACQDSDVNRAGVLLNVGHALRFLHARTRDRAVLDEALAAFRDAATMPSASTATRVSAGAAYGRLALSAGKVAQADKELGQAVELLPLVAARHLARSDAEYWLGRFAGLAADAASAAIEADRPERALTLLELGRGVLITQTIESRTDLRKLRTQAPELADRFQWLCGELDADNGRSGAGGSLPASGARSAERRDELATELDGLVRRIRDLPSQGRFLLPPTVDQLATATTDGPVVYLNPSRHRCDALVLTPNGVRVVALPALGGDAINRRPYDFLAALRIANDPATSVSDRISAERVVGQTLSWMWDAIAEPVLNALGLTAPPPVGTPYPRLWWAPGGVLNFLPLHAAGHHDGCSGDGAARTVMDRVVSSYTPTVRALGYARSRRTLAGRDDRVLVVAMPHTPGASDLPGTSREAELLRDRFPRSQVLVGAQATKDAVMQELAGSTVAHFACHAYGDPEVPSASRLLVHDHVEHPLTVLDVSRLHLPHAQLAFLSACATARPTQDLADEAVHIVTAFQLAGYAHVVGTLWPIDDSAAVSVADEVYRALTVADTGIDVGHTAYALHAAIMRLRASCPAIPSQWAAYIHAGA